MNFKSANQKANTGYFKTCPRCEWRSLECLSTHRHCVNCLYYEVFFDSEITLSEAAEGEKILNQIEIRKKDATSNLTVKPQTKLKKEIDL